MNPGMLSFPKGLQDLVLWLVPVGVGFDWWDDEAFIPKGYIIPVGQDILQSQYPRLYARWTRGGVHKFSAGSVPNSTKAPDLRGRGVILRDNMGGTAANRVTSGGSGITASTLGATGGAETVALSTAQLASHPHGLQNKADALSSVDGGFEGNATPGYLNVGGRTTAAAGSGTAHQNMHPIIVCNYIIRAG